MRILIDGRAIQDRYPGIGRYLYNLMMALAPQLDGELMVLTSADAFNTRYDLSALEHHPNVSLHPTAVPIRSWQEQTQLPRLFYSLQPDLIHQPYYIRPFRYSIPSILTLYDVIPSRFPQYFSRAAGLTIRSLKRLSIRRSDAFVTISEATGRDFQTFYNIPPHRVTVTPLAADPAFRPQPEDAIAALRQRHQLPARYALYLGSNKPHKNLPRLIDGWARGRRSAGVPHEVTLVIAGVWDERYPQARVRVADAGLETSVRFLGPVAENDLPALYAGAEIFVFPSLYEGFGLPVLEAAASGTAVLCSDIPSLREIVGDDALTFDPDDPEAIAQALAASLDDEAMRQSLQDRARRIAQRFTWQHTAALTLQAYRSALHLPE